MRQNSKALEDEHEALRRLSNGDENAYTLIYLHYLPRLYRYIYPFTNESRAETEEIIQEVFLKVWIRREILPGVASFEYYILRMAKNQLMDARRRKETRHKHETQFGTSSTRDEKATEDDFQYREYNRIAREAIEALPPRKREVFQLSTQEDLSLDEIALRLAISRSAVKKNLYGAIQIIRTHLKKHGDLLILVASLIHHN